MKSLLFFLTFLPLLVSAQVNITGKVTSGENEPLAYATVILKDKRQALIEGVITSEKGEFEIRKPPAGEYTIEINYLGYKTFTREILIDSTKQKVLLERIVLLEDANVLKEVIVEGKTAEVSLKLGKKIFRVGKDLTSQNGTVTDVLNNVPSVTVSPSGGISLRGNPNVQVLINGRRSGLTQSQALEQLSAEIIDRIEVISNPSAKYDSSGSSGIINIILKKNRQSGFNGQVRLRTGIPNDHRASLNANYRFNKFNFFANAGIRYTDYRGEYSKNQSTMENGVTTVLDFNEDEDRHDDGRLYYSGVDYFINDKNTITLAYFRNETEDTDETRLNYNITTSEVGETRLFTLGNSNEKRDYNQLEWNYTKDFEKEGQKLTFDFQYDFFNSSKRWTLDNEEIGSNDSDFTDIRTLADVSLDDFVGQLDFINPITKKTNVELGLKYENRSTTNDFLAEQLVNGSFETIDDINNSLEYNEQIIAGYLQFNSNWKNVSFQLGLRLEDTDVLIEASTDGLNSEQDYTNLFPSASLGYAFSDSIDGQISYSRRIGRPSLWDLNPFFELKDFSSRFTGNPMLTPSYTDAFELSTIFKGGKFRINPSLYFSRTQDVFQLETIQEENEVFTQRPINLDLEKRYGFELSATYDPVAWLGFNVDLNAYTFEQEGIINDLDASFDDSTWFANLTTNVSPSKTLQIQTRLFYQGERATAQIDTKAITNVDIAISKTLFNKKASLIFNVSNLFDSRAVEQLITDPGFNISQTRNRNAQRYNLNFIYRFNQKSTDKNRRARRSNRN
ncbi:TonB-dependent receptor [uncultured Croceitalea sp.]|uniref:TonB-dependent receptor domain-containing protein n=1 Tax=uncultured Croceitalea sp. TaxID=1798908 RepID=UPI0033056A70